MRQSSIEAHEKIKPFKESHYSIIKSAMELIDKPCTSRLIASKCEDLEYHDVAKRLSEMERKEIIKVVGRAFNEPNRPLLWELINK